MFKLSDFPVTTVQVQSWLNGLDSAWFFLAISSLLLLVSALMFLHSRNRMVKQQRNLRDMQHDIRAITAAAIGVGERVLELERRQRRISEKQEQFDTYDPANVSYEQAIYMVKNGASAEELMEMCDIRESEAQLMALMHRLDQTA